MNIPTWAKYGVLALIIVVAVVVIIMTNRPASSAGSSNSAANEAIMQQNRAKADQYRQQFLQQHPNAAPAGK